MICLRDVIRHGFSCGIVATLVCLSPALATAQSVRGFGEVPNGGLSASEISVDAWLDDDGVAQGDITWIGDDFLLPGVFSPAEPFIMEVTQIIFDGNTAYVSGIVIASPEGLFDGQAETFSFTDNSGTGEPDEIDGSPIVAGNIVVTD